MQCIWQSIARSASVGFGRIPTFFAHARPFASRTSLYENSSHLLKTRIYSPRSLSTTNISLSELSSTEIASLFPLSSEWTRPSRLALAATKAVHMSLEEHGFENAMAIVNTIRYAALPKEAHQLKFWKPIKRLQVTIPPSVSPRLPAHALIHGFIRHGLFHQASHFALHLMKNHVRVRGRTLERITDGLAKSATDKDAASKASDARLKHHMRSLLGDSNVLLIQHHKPSNPNTAFALQLWLSARKSNSQRTRAMFNTLITLCLINGEIIIAALLFGLMVKDWEHRSNSLTAYCQLKKSSPLPFEKSKAAYLKHLSTQDLRPLPDTLAEILSPVKQKLEEATPDDVNDPDFQQALQALTVLGDLLNNRQLPFSKVETLIKALYTCPKVDNWVWVMGTTGAIHVPAYQFFHRTLLYLAQNPPTHSAVPKRAFIVRYAPTQDPKHQQDAQILRKIVFTPPHPRSRMQPAMTANSYNSMIHYALRHRLSPTLAKRIIEHMTVQRVPPLPIDKTTPNILLRASALYRQNDFVGDLVHVLRLNGINVVDQDLTSTRTRSLPSNFCTLKEFINKVQIPSDLTLDQMSQDPFTLSTYLSALASGGRPKLVIEIMRFLLPFFQFHHVRRRERLDKAMEQKWEESVINAMKLGPHVLSVFLQALIKGGTSREAHTLFAVISHASQRFETPSGKADYRWHIPVVIYTQMLEVYRGEYGLRRRRMVLDAEALPTLLRRAEALYRMAKNDMLQSTSPTTTLDSRFYSALLKILIQPLPVKCYSIRESRHHYVKIRHQYARTGVIDNRGRVALLEEVVADMDYAGYPIPPGFHHLFITDGTGMLERSHRLPELDRHPVAYPELRTIKPYTLPVSTRKSLPFLLRRRTLIGMYRSRKAKKSRMKSCR